MMNIAPMRNRLAYPAGVAPGFDPTHLAAKNCKLSAIPAGTSFVNLLSGKQATISGGTTTRVMLDKIGPAIYFGGLGSTAIATFASVMPAVKSHKYTFGVVVGLVPNNNAVSGSFIGADRYSPGTAGGTAQNGYGFTIGDSRGNFYYGVHDDDRTEFDKYFYDHDNSTGPLDLFFVAVSANFAGGAVGPVNVVITPIKEDPYFVGVGRIVTKTFTSVAGDTNTAFLNQNVYVGGPEAYYVAAAAYSDNYLSVQELRKWAEDPWTFWYPNINDVSSQPITPSLPTTPTFTPNSPQIIVADPSGAKVVS